MHRRWIPKSELTNKVEWLRDEIWQRGYKIGGMYGGSADGAVSNSLSHLNETII